MTTRRASTGSTGCAPVATPARPGAGAGHYGCCDWLATRPVDRPRDTDTAGSRTVAGRADEVGQARATDRDMWWAPVTFLAGIKAAIRWLASPKFL